MKSFVTKENRTGGADSGSATSWGANEQNSVNTELNNVITTTGQTPTAGTGPDTNTKQLAIAMNIYAQTGYAYQDSGVSDAYVLTAIAGLTQPPSYYDGSKITFVTANTNTGASTVNVEALGVKKILNSSGGELLIGSITTSSHNELIYDSAADSAAGAFILNIRNSFPGEVIIGGKDIQQQGILGYNPLVNYLAGVSYVIGSNGYKYACKINNGPSSTVVDPVGDLTKTWIANESIGVLQNWTDVSASRALGVTYTNTTGRPIQLSVSVQLISQLSELSVDSTVISSRLNNDGVQAVRVAFNEIIPDGLTYIINGGSLVSWYELI